ncbi:MAG: thioesterase [Herpetosiphonaceae bacterium]|nr:MAG: thioesterase [Herpetosiphonaceae bacterium]
MQKRQLDSQACFVCGKANLQGLQLDFYEEENRVQTIFQPRTEHQGWPGFVHAGIIMSILDETIGRAAFLIDAWVMTGRLEVRFRSPAPIDQSLTFVGTVVGDRGKAVELEGFAQLPDGSVVAEGRGLYMRVPDELREALEQQIAAGY